MRIQTLSLFAGVIVVAAASAQPSVKREPIDTTVVRRIWNEGTENSQVMTIAHYLTDICGPRLTGSPQYMKAATWSMKKMNEWGLTNVHLDGWGPFGRSWSLKHYSATVMTPDVFPLLSFPKAWSPGVRAESEAIYFDAKTDSALDAFRGKLKGKFVLLDDLRKLTPLFEPRAERRSDTTLLELANADFPRPRRSRFQVATSPEGRKQGEFGYRKMNLLYEEGALAILTSSRGDGGNIFVQQASVPSHPDTPMARRPRPYQLSAQKILPQIQVNGEHYNRLVRTLQRGEKVTLAVNLQVQFHKADSGYNVIGEIQGTDLKDEIVMIGAHLDSWHAGTGATDNAVGSAVCLEAMRILKALDLKPRRTIRVALWSGEEQGLYGSESYVKKYFGERASDSTRQPILKPAAEKFSVYFNQDNGTGRYRGVYMQGNEAVRPIFRQWLTATGDPTAQTLTLQNTGSTDHVSFDRIGLPGFQFIQDEIEYGSFTWHAAMDVYDRLVEEDVKQSSVIMAIFAYNAAMRDEKIPRKP